MTLGRMKHVADPRQEILNAVGSLEGFVVGPSSLLIGIYERPEKTAGGIILAHQTRKEDLYQGSVGLVLMLGPLCFVDDDKAKFGGFTVQPGDWVIFKASDGFDKEIRGKHCRWLQDVHIRGITPEPDLVW